MKNDYSGGYFKALLDISNFCSMHSEHLKSLRNKKYTVLLSLIKRLAENHDERSLFSEYGGHVKIYITDKNEVTVIKGI